MIHRLHQDYLSLSRKVLDDHRSGVEPLQSQVSPPNRLHVSVLELFAPDFTLRLDEIIVELLDCFMIERLKKKGVHRGVSFGYIKRNRLAALSPYGVHPAFFLANSLDTIIPTS